MNLTGTGHLAYYNGTACPITLPHDKSWMKIAKEQFVKGVEFEGTKEGLKELLLGQLRMMENKLNIICAGSFSTQEKITQWCNEIGMPNEGKVASLWYMNVYTLQHFLEVEVDDDFGILHMYEETKNKTKVKKQKVNDPCDCGSGQKYKKCCMNK